MRLDSKAIVESPLFAKCVSLIDKDEHIQALKGKLVGTSDAQSSLYDNSFIILSFLRQLYINSPTYSQNLFDHAYSSFEELFYSEVLKIIDTVRLHNFRYDSSLIELGYGISIRRVPVQRVTHTVSEGMQSWVYARPDVSDFVIERLYTRKKAVLDPHKINESNTNQDIPKAELTDSDSHQALPKTMELFDFVISAFRILKPSDIFTEAELSSQLLTFHPMTDTGRATVYTMASPKTTLFGKASIIEEKDIPELKSIFNFIVEQKDNRFDVARRRLSLGNERGIPEDRLLDYMIGLEALYLLDGNNELTFRLSLRISFLLYKDPAERKDVYHFVKNMYKIRSKIVHGDKPKIAKDEMDKLEELLRKSLKLWLENKSNFSIDNLTNMLFTSETN